VFCSEPQIFGRNDGLLDRPAWVKTDRAGTWMAVWGHSPSFQDPFEFLSVQSTDDGQTWSAPQSITTGNDDQPQGLVSTGIDSFVLASTQTATGTFVLHTPDSGASWSTPRAVPLPAEIPSTLAVPDWSLHGDLTGTLLVGYTTFAWNLYDFHVVVSTDDGLTWGAPIVPGAGHTTTADSFCPRLRVAPDGGGGWMAVWESNDSLGGAVGTDSDIVFSHSGDGGVSWSAPAAVGSLAATDGTTGDDRPQVGSDGLG